MDYKTHFIKNLKDYRKQNNLTQDDLAEILGYSQKNIAKWEQGISFPPIDVLVQLSKFMKISLDSLLGLNKSIKEMCTDYIISTQNLNENDTELVYNNISSICSSFVTHLLCNLDLNEIIENETNETTKLAVKYFLDNNHITVNNEKWEMSNIFANECFEQFENIYRKSVILGEKQVKKYESLLKNNKLSVIEQDDYNNCKRILKADKELLAELKKVKEEYFKI